MGGLIAVKLAASRPDLVRTLTLISPAMPDPLIRPALARFPLLGAPGRRLLAATAVGRVPGPGAGGRCHGHGLSRPWRRPPGTAS